MGSRPQQCSGSDSGEQWVGPHAVGPGGCECRRLGSRPHQSLAATAITPCKVYFRLRKRTLKILRGFPPGGLPSKRFCGPPGGHCALPRRPACCGTVALPLGCPTGHEPTLNLGKFRGIIAPLPSIPASRVGAPNPRRSPRNKSRQRDKTTRHPPDGAAVTWNHQVHNTRRHVSSTPWWISAARGPTARVSSCACHWRPGLSTSLAAALGGPRFVGGVPPGGVPRRTG